jgi:16S rRNA (uracil1498-N3)-methyltransferase
MTRRRFYAPPEAFSSDRQTLSLTADEARHVRDVLRLKLGDEVYVFNGEGKEFQCRIHESRKDIAHLNVISEVEPARPESPLRLTLGVALLKSDKFDLVVQKATELGVVRIVPLTTRLADIHLRDKSDASKRVTRWQRIALTAAKQSGRALVPEVAAPVSLDEFIELAPRDEQGKLMFSERAGRSLVEFKNNFSGTPQSIAALVGSEGGWTDEEIALAREADWTIVTLGGRTLRAETAAIAGTALLQHLFGDLI